MKRLLSLLACLALVGATSGFLIEDFHGARTEDPPPASGVYRLDCSDFTGEEVCAIDAALDANYVNGASGDQGSWDAANDGYNLNFPANAGENGSGQVRWLEDWTNASSTTVIAFRWMGSAGFVNRGGSSAGRPKVMIIYDDDSCAGDGDEFTMHTVQRHAWEMYNQCGSYHYKTNEAGSNFDLQPGGDTSCSFQDRGNPVPGKPQLCIEPEGGVWWTFVYFFDFDTPTIIEAWAMTDEDTDKTTAETWYQILDIPSGFSGTHGSNPGPDEIRSLALTSYTTDIDSPHSGWEVWYNDVLVITNVTWNSVKTVYGIPTS